MRKVQFAPKKAAVIPKGPGLTHGLGHKKTTIAAAMKSTKATTLGRSSHAPKRGQTSWPTTAARAKGVNVAGKLASHVPRTISVGHGSKATSANLQKGKKGALKGR